MLMSSYLRHTLLITRVFLTKLRQMLLFLCAQSKNLNDFTENLQKTHYLKTSKSLTLVSGRVQCTCCYKVTGAAAPVLKEGL